jgi:hypothetical protein
VPERLLCEHLDSEEGVPEEQSENLVIVSICGLT